MLPDMFYLSHGLWIFLSGSTPCFQLFSVCSGVFSSLEVGTEIRRWSCCRALLAFASMHQGPSFLSPCSKSEDSQDSGSWQLVHPGQEAQEF